MPPMTKRHVQLTWEGKAESLAEPRGPVSPCRIEEELGRPGPADDAPLPRRIIHGDAADIARALVEEGLGGRSTWLISIPPTPRGSTTATKRRIEGPATGRVARSTAYRDKWDDAASYLDMLFPRLAATRPLLKDTGAIWIQVDWRANYLVRALCDEIFGRERFLNEIVWKRAPNLGRQARSGQFGRTLDTIIVYGASPKARLVPSERLIPVARGEPSSTPPRGVLLRWLHAGTTPTRRSSGSRPRGAFTARRAARLPSNTGSSATRKTASASASPSMPSGSTSPPCATPRPRSARATRPRSPARCSSESSPPALRRGAWCSTCLRARARPRGGGPSRAGLHPG